MLEITRKEEFIELRKKVLEKEFKRMNPMQREAVFTADGPVLILAGAGSGKTTVVVNRIANLIKYGKAYNSTFVQDEVTEEDVNNMREFLENDEKLPDETVKHISVSACLPWKIMAITFTNKAAGELKERLCNMLGEENGNDIWASTFHSSCARMLRRDADRLGYTSHFTIYDTDDMKRLMKDCMKQLDISDKAFPIKSVLGEISRAKDSLVSVQEFMSQAGEDYRLKQIARCYDLYQKRLRDADAMDFDDLIVNTVRLFEENPDVLDYYQNRFRYLMVDEYQDTNHAQYRFVKLLAERSQNICVVGDDDQSIYKFRGATIENIMSFENTFSGAKVIRLEQNYRSTQNILDAANAIIENNTERKGKNLWTDNGAGDKIVMMTATDEQDEADKIAQEILKGVSEERKFSDYAVLYRMNSQSLSFERMFAKQGVPHRILGGLRFYERAEIKDMLAYLSFINNHDDEIRLRRIINTPKRGIGDRSVDVAAEIAQQIGETLYEVMRHAEDFPALSRAANKLKEFTKMIDELTEMLEDEEKTINDVYNEILDRTNYLSYLKTSDPERAEDKIENVKELSSNIVRYEEEGGNLTDFLEEIALITDIDNYDNEADTVVLMTIHSAKGLEFPVVFLPGWEENVFPGQSVFYNPSEVEEERRLAYVAVTRAKQKLYIFNAEQRIVFGQTNRNRISRFAEEIPTELIERKYSRQRMSFSSMFSTPNFSSAQSKPASTKTAFAASGFSAPPKVKPTPAGTYNPGDTVMHKTFGQGVILSVSTMGNDSLLEIAFEKVGTKKLMANFARLEKV
ncbi:MAG: 3'-5' exonuclease [Clostridia bacterium]|nr:3'-5' exonuclease [Clostridia bacterium]